MLSGNLVSQKPQTVEPRHWSTEQSYITGDVVAMMVGEGWGVKSLKEVASEGRARMYLCVLERDGSTMAVRVLDGPFVRSLARERL